MKEYIIKAKELRNKDNINKLPTGIGYYKWYAKKNELDLLLSKLNINFNSIPLSEWDIEDGLYCIYLGIAKKSIKERLNWHVNDKHTYSSVKYGTLSTLRQSLSAVLFNDESKEEDTNKFIDKLIIHYFYYDELNKNDKKILENMETKLINKYLYILNGAKNKNIYKPKNLKELRKKGKEKGIKQYEE